MDLNQSQKVLTVLVTAIQLGVLKKIDANDGLSINATKIFLTC